MAAESGREATSLNLTVRYDDEIHGSNGVIIFLMTVEVSVLQILSQQQNIWSPILSIDISVFLIYRITAIYIAICCSTPCDILQKINLLLGTLSATLPLLIILPPLGWSILGIWILSFLVFAKNNHQKLFEVNYRSIREMLISILLGPQLNANVVDSAPILPI